MNLPAEDFQGWLVEALLKSKAATIDKNFLVNQD